jgi:hypothetical protein
VKKPIIIAITVAVADIIRDLIRGLVIGSSTAVYAMNIVVMDCGENNIM